MTAILLISLLLRFVAINQSLWLDEAVSINTVKNLSLGAIISQFSPTDFHPPLYYVVLKIWASFLGYSPISTRLLSIMFSLLAGIVVYRLGVLLKNKKFSLWSMSIFLFNPLIIYYSQEVRMYSLVVLLSSLCLLYFLLSRKNPTLKNIFMFNLFSFLSFLSFYGSAFYILSFFLFLLLKRDFKLLLRLLPGSVLALILLYPLLSIQISNSSKAIASVGNWSLVLGRLSPKNILLIPLKFCVGRISFFPKIVYLGVASLWTFYVFFQAKSGFIKNKLLSFLFFTPLLLGSFFSLFYPLMQYFRFLYLLPVLSLVLAYSRRARVPLILGFFLFSSAYLFFSSQHREDWQSLSLSLPQGIRVAMVPSFSDPVKYYRPDISILDINQSSQLASDNFLVIPYGFAIHGIDHHDQLNLSGYSLKDTQNFHQLILEHWAK